MTQMYENMEKMMNFNGPVFPDVQAKVNVTDMLTKMQDVGKHWTSMDAMK